MDKRNHDKVENDNLDYLKNEVSHVGENQMLFDLGKTRLKKIIPHYSY